MAGCGLAIIKTAFRLIVAPLFVALAVMGAIGAGALAGEDLHAFVVVGGKRVPLPDGDWRVVGRGFVEAVPAFGLKGLVERVVLFHRAPDAPAGDVVDAFALAQANVVSGTHGWGFPAECARRDIPLARIVYQTSADGLCVFALPVATDISPDSADDPVWASALIVAGLEGWRVPERWLMGGARLATRAEFVDVRYHFASPSPSPPPTGGAERADPRMAALIAWTEALAEPLTLGLKNRLDAASTMAMPWGATAPPGAGASATAPPGAGTSAAAIGGALAAAAYVADGATNVGLYLLREMMWVDIAKMGAAGRQPALELPAIGRDSP